MTSRTRIDVASPATASAAVVGEREVRGVAMVRNATPVSGSQSITVRPAPCCWRRPVGAGDQQPAAAGEGDGATVVPGPWATNEWIFAPLAFHNVISSPPERSVWPSGEMARADAWSGRRRRRSGGFVDAPQRVPCCALRGHSGPAPAWLSEMARNSSRCRRRAGCARRRWRDPRRAGHRLGLAAETAAAPSKVNATARMSLLSPSGEPRDGLSLTMSQTRTACRRDRRRRVRAVAETATDRGRGVPGQGPAAAPAGGAGSRGRGRLRRAFSPAASVAARPNGERPIQPSADAGGEHHHCGGARPRRVIRRR